jgi:hypothetical protein
MIKLVQEQDLFLKTNPVRGRQTEYLWHTTGWLCQKCLIEALVKLE